MDISLYFIKFSLNLLDHLLPVLHVPDSFYLLLDSSIVVFINILESTAWFIPLDVFVVCLTTMIVVDNYTLGVRTVKYIVKLVRG